jgi:hypothetical protein
MKDSVSRAHKATFLQKERSDLEGQWFMDYIVILKINWDHEPRSENAIAIIYNQEGREISEILDKYAENFNEPRGALRGHCIPLIRM